MGRFREWGLKLTIFMMARFPFLNAITLMMLLGERATTERTPPIEPKMIYANIAGFLICGLCMSSRIRTKEFSLMYAGQLLYFAYLLYTSEKLQYGEWTRIRIAMRQIGCCGMYILFAYLADRKRSQQIRRIGEILVGLYLMSSAYIINTSIEDKKAFLAHIPGGDWGRFFITLLIASSALCFFSGYFLRDISMAMVLVFSLTTLLIDCDMIYWVERRKLHLWYQIRLITDNISIITAFLLLVQKFDNKIKME